MRHKDQEDVDSTSRLPNSKGFGNFSLKTIGKWGFLVSTSKLGAVVERKQGTMMKLASRGSDVVKAPGPSKEQGKTLIMFHASGSRVCI